MGFRKILYMLVLYLDERNKRTNFQIKENKNNTNG